MDTAFTVAPLSSYLAAVGLLRIVGEQLDPSAAGSWHGGRFKLQTNLPIQTITSFLANEYRPSPCFTPWNKDSGFLDGRPTPEFRQLDAPRFAEIRRIAEAAAGLVPQFASKGKLEKEAKVELFDALDRAGDSDAWSAWLAICGVTFFNNKGEQEMRFPALLGGTGGAFGRADFGVKFVKALQVATAEHFTAAILGSNQQELLIQAGDSLIYDPASRSDGQQGYGIATRDTQESRSARANPAYLILLAEGMTLFEGYAITTASDGDPSDGQQQAAFTLAVQHNSSGYPSSSWLEDGGNLSEELWCPIWDRPCHYSDVRDALRRIALLPLPRQLRTGTDLALFASRLGRRLKLTGFARYAFPARIGKGTKIPSLIEVFALGEAQDDRSDVLAGIVKLSSSLRSYAKNKAVPASYRHAAERLVAEVEVVAAGSGSYSELLKRLLAWRRQEDVSQQEPKATDQQATAIRRSFQFGSPSLPPQWFDLLARELDGPEWRLALSLGTGQIAAPKARKPGQPGKGSTADKERKKADRLDQPLATGRPYARLMDVLLLLDSRLDAELIADLAIGVAWIERRGLPKLPPPEETIPWLPPDYLAGLMLNQLQFGEHVPIKGDRDRWRELLLAGRPEEAMAIALHRLQISEVVSWRWPAVTSSDPERLLRAVEVRINPVTLGRVMRRG